MNNDNNFSDLFSLDNEQPTTCPQCGARTSFEEQENDQIGYYQLHDCLNETCLFQFVGVFSDDETEYDLERNV